MISFEQFVMEDGVPIYLQIITYLKRGIAAGVIHDGDEVPSRRMLSALLGVNPNTVQKSYAMLEEEGLLISRTGAKSCIRVTEGAVQRLKQELLSAGVNGMGASMNQMGRSLADAQKSIEALWEAEA